LFKLNNNKQKENCGIITHHSFARRSLCGYAFYIAKEVKMAREKYGFIYITTNNINNKKYIGQKKYIQGWEEYLGSGIALNNAIKKYGKENFSKKIIDESYTSEELNQKEIFWINFYDAVKSKDYYNIAYGGDGGNTIAGYTETQLKIHSKKLSNSLKGVINQGGNNPNAKKVICLNTMEVFDTTVIAGKKYNIPDYSIQSACQEKSLVRTAGYHHITKEKMLWEYYDENKTYTYKKFTRNDMNCKTVVMCLNTNEVFNSINEASEKYNISPTKISHNCNHLSKIGGFDSNGNPLYWIKYDEYMKHGIREEYYQRDKIQQFDSNGNLVNSFVSIKEASVSTGLNKNRIARNINGVTDFINGYKFRVKYI
jgi:group I intron endonuclease